MATTKQRINISISKETRNALKLLAKRDEETEATKAARLLAFALEIEEDRYFEQLANKRLAGNKRWIKDSNKIWD